MKCKKCGVGKLVMGTGVCAYCHEMARGPLPADAPAEWRTIRETIVRKHEALIKQMEDNR